MCVWGGGGGGMGVGMGKGEVSKRRKVLAIA